MSKARTGLRPTAPCPTCGKVIEMQQHWRHVPICSRVKELLDQGMDDYQIAEVVGLKVKTVSAHRFRITKRKGTGRPVEHWRKVTPEVQARIEELTADWWPRAEIAQELNLHPQTVSDYAGHPEVGAEWLAVQRWARSKHPDLFESIKRMEIA